MRWLSILITALAITSITIVTCDLINLDENIWASTSSFHREHDYALIDHVIKTLPLFIADCLAACQEMLRCFSVNYINFHNGSFICELNWSNKKQKKNSFVRREGYEYSEPQIFLHCEGKSCAQKEALEGEWFKFNSSKFKIVSAKKTWSKAQSHCQSLGGDLASFRSHTECLFVRENMFYYHSLVDPSVETFSLHGGAAIVTKDSRKAIYFDGVNDYATIPSFDIRKTDFTIGFWFKDASIRHGFVNLFNNKNKSLQQFSLYIYYYFMTFTLFNTDSEQLFKNAGLLTKEIPVGEWYHLTITWNRQSKQYKLYLNSVLKKTRISSYTNIDLFDTGETHYEMGAEGGSKWFKGWISELSVFKQELKQSEVENLKDGLYLGAWIGLNDINKEGTFKWSNNQPLTYMSAVQHQHVDKDCVYLLQNGVWSLHTCNEEHPFICETF